MIRGGWTTTLSAAKVVPGILWATFCVLGALFRALFAACSTAGFVKCVTLASVRLTVAHLAFLRAALKATSLLGLCVNAETAFGERGAPKVAIYFLVATFRLMVHVQAFGACCERIYAAMSINGAPTSTTTATTTAVSWRWRFYIGAGRGISDGVK